MNALVKAEESLHESERSHLFLHAPDPRDSLTLLAKEPQVRGKRSRTFPGHQTGNLTGSMKIVSARIAIIEQQFGTSISADRKRLVGFHFANLINDIMEAGQLNLTITGANDSIGSCDHDHYFGSFRLLFANESDGSLFMPANANCDRLEPFEAGSQFMDIRSNILMLRQLTRSEKTGTSLLSNTHPSVYVLMSALMLILLTAVMLRQKMSPRKKDRRTKASSGDCRDGLRLFWLLYGVACRQAMLIRSAVSNIRLLFLLFCLLMLLFQVFLSSFFKTDLMIKTPVTTIDTLEDLAAAKQFRATFPREWNLWTIFRDSKEPALKAIWSRATHGTGDPKVATIVMTNAGKTISPYELIAPMKEGRVYICPDRVNRFMVDAFCIGYTPEATEIVYLSRRSFFSILMMAIYRKDTDPVIKERFNFILTSFNEHGFHDFYLKNPLGILRKTLEQRACYQRMEIETIGDGSEEEFRRLATSDFRGLARVSFAFLLLSLLCLLGEDVLHRLVTSCRRQRRLKRITPPEIKVTTAPSTPAQRQEAGRLTAVSPRALTL